MPLCSTCRKLKKAAEFPTYNSRKGTIRNPCKECLKGRRKRELARCDREIAECERHLREGHPDVAGAALGLADWSAEKRIIEGEK